MFWVLLEACSPCSCLTFEIQSICLQIIFMLSKVFLKKLHDSTKLNIGAFRWRGCNFNHFNSLGGTWPCSFFLGCASVLKRLYLGLDIGLLLSHEILNFSREEKWQMLSLCHLAEYQSPAVQYEEWRPSRFFIHLLCCNIAKVISKEWCFLWEKPSFNVTRPLSKNSWFLLSFPFVATNPLSHEAPLCLMLGHTRNLFCGTIFKASNFEQDTIRKRTVGKIPLWRGTAYYSWTYRAWELCLASAGFRRASLLFIALCLKSIATSLDTFCYMILFPHFCLSLRRT